MKNEIKEIISDGFKSAFGGIIANEGIDHASGIIATALHKAGYRKQSETVKEIIKKILAFSYYIKFEDTNGKDREELVVYESKIKQIAEQYGKEVE